MLMSKDKLTAIWGHRSKWLAGLFLAAMLGLGLVSMRGDSAIVDEVAHIPSGYSYLHYGDYRLNPEHPPLIKDLSGVPLQFLKAFFPTDNKAWTTDPNGQWETGWHFLYHYGNNADQILFWSRLPILLLAIVFGAGLFWFAKKHFGPRVATLSVFLYAFEPNILAHSRFVTTDIGIAAFNFLALATLWRWLKKPNWPNVLLAGLAFGLAQLAKFSAILLIPFVCLMVGVWIITSDVPKKFWARVWKYGFQLVGIFAIGFALVWVVYIPHTIHMPDAVQNKLIEASLPSGYQHAVSKYLIKYNNIPGVKPFAQYALGVLMVQNRVSGGNTTYFLGEVTNQSFKSYFPFTYAVKTPIPLLILIAMSLISGAWLYLRHKPFAVWKKFKSYVQEHLIEFSSLAYIGYYAYFSITGNLNLGIRHLMPIIPLIILLTARQIVEIFDWIKTRVPVIVPKVIFGGLIGWFLFENLLIFPSYVAYFNELKGGPDSAYKYVTDSSIDWGQDLKRLKTYIGQHPEIDKIAVDYFGGGVPRYYFCDRKYGADGQLIKNTTGYDCSKSVYLEWHAQQGIPPTKYIAVSETYLMNDLYYAPKRGDMGYKYLRDRAPIAKIGHSIYIYKL